MILNVTKKNQRTKNLKRKEPDSFIIGRREETSIKESHIKKELNCQVLPRGRERKDKRERMGVLGKRGRRKGRVSSSQGEGLGAQPLTKAKRKRRKKKETPTVFAGPLAGRKKKQLPLPFTKKKGGEINTNVAGARNVHYRWGLAMNVRKNRWAKPKRDRENEKNGKGKSSVQHQENRQGFNR